MDSRSRRNSHAALGILGVLLALLAGCTSETTSPKASCGNEPGAQACTGNDAGIALVDGQVPIAASTDGAVLTTDSAVTTQAAPGLPCDVQTVVQSQCASCHGTTPSFGAPMSLVTLADWQKPAPVTRSQTVAVTALARVSNDAMPMPPAPHARLSAADIATLSAWVNAGTPASTAACASSPDAGAPPTATVTVTKPADCAETFELQAHGDAAGQPFGIAAAPKDGGNQYHCFYFAPPYKSDSSMLWFESILDNTKHLHHWILYATDNASHSPGTHAACNASEAGSYFVAGWAPGADNVVVPSDTGLLLPSGPKAGLILEVHYYNSDGGAGQTDHSGLRFCTAPKTARAHVAAVHSAGTEGICIQPGESKEVVGNCKPRTDMGDIHIVGIWPHMHKLARRQEVVVRRANGTSEVIHDAPFDFNAQVFYPINDIVLHAGDTLDTHCFYQNTTSSAVHYGENTQNEMCYAFVMAWPAGALANAASPFGTTNTGYPLNRCADNLSILQSCNGASDAPVTVQQ